MKKGQIVVSDHYKVKVTGKGVAKGSFKGEIIEVLGANESYPVGYISLRWAESKFKPAPVEIIVGECYKFKGDYVNFLFIPETQSIKDLGSNKYVLSTVIDLDKLEIRKGVYVYIKNKGRSFVHAPKHKQWAEHCIKIGKFISKSEFKALTDQPYDLADFSFDNVVVKKSRGNT